MRHAPEARLKPHGLMTEDQIARGGVADVEHDPAVGDIGLGHRQTLGFGVDDDDDQPQPPTERSYHDGQRVRHPVFGEGLIVAGQITNFDEEVTVMFQGDVGLKKLAVSYAKLEAVT